MSVRTTSAEVYRRIEAEGLLSERRWQVYSTLYEHGPLTASELWRKVERRFGLDYLINHNVNPRLAELRELGVVAEVGQRECSITGNRAIVWDVTANLPAVPAPRVTPKQRAQALEAALRRVLETRPVLAVRKAAADHVSAVQEAWDEASRLLDDNQAC